MVADDLCDFCGYKEDEMHVIVHCKEDKRIWSLVPFLAKWGNMVSSVADFF